MMGQDPCVKYTMLLLQKLGLAGSRVGDEAVMEAQGSAQVQLADSVDPDSMRQVEAFIRDAVRHTENVRESVGWNKVGESWDIAAIDGTKGEVHRWLWGPSVGFAQKGAFQEDT